MPAPTRSPLTISARIAFAAYAAISALHVATIIWGPRDWVYPTKLLLMPALIAAVLIAAPPRRSNRIRTLSLLAAALLFSWFGDGASFFFPWFDDELPMMLASFGIAHLLYIAIFVTGIRARPIARWSYVYIAWWVVFVLWLWPHLGSLQWPVAIYGVVLGATAMLSTRGGAITALGGAFFLTSDSILGLRIFQPDALPVAFSSPAVMFTYTLGQGLLAYGIVRQLRAQPDTLNG